MDYQGRSLEGGPGKDGDHEAVGIQVYMVIGYIISPTATWAAQA